MASKLGQAILHISMTGVRQIQNGATTVQASMQKLGAAATQVGSALTSASRGLRNFSLVVAAALTPIVLLGGKFQQAMQDVKAVMKDASEASTEAAANFAKLTAKAQELGETTRFTATEVAEAMKFMALAGLNTEEVLAGVGEVLNLAAAGNLELARASEIAVDTMRAFNIEASNLARVTDVIAVTAANTNTSVEKLGFSFQLSAPIAEAFGQSLEETAAALGVLANAGIKGSVSGAGLGQVLSQASKGTKKAQETLGKYGLTIQDINPEIKSLTEIVETFEDANISATDTLMIFGVRAGRQMLALKNQGSDAMKKIQGYIEDATGAARTMAEIRMDSVIGSFTELKSIVQGLGITIFQTFQGVLQKAIDKITGMVRAFNEWAKANKDVVASFVKSIAIFGAAAAALSVVLGVAGALLTTLGALIPAITLVVVFWKAFLIGAAALLVLLSPLVAIIAVMVADFEFFTEVLNVVAKAVWAIGKAFLEGLYLGLKVVGTVMATVMKAVLWAVGGWEGFYVVIEGVAVVVKYLTAILVGLTAILGGTLISSIVLLTSPIWGLAMAVGFLIGLVKRLLIWFGLLADDSKKVGQSFADMAASMGMSAEQMNQLDWMQNSEGAKRMGKEVRDAAAFYDDLGKNASLTGTKLNELTKSWDEGGKSVEGLTASLEEQMAAMITLKRTISRLEDGDVKTSLKADLATREKQYEVGVRTLRTAKVLKIVVEDTERTVEEHIEAHERRIKLQEELVALKLTEMNMAGDDAAARQKAAEAHEAEKERLRGYVHDLKVVNDHNQEYLEFVRQMRNDGVLTSEEITAAWVDQRLAQQELVAAQESLAEGAEDYADLVKEIHDADLEGLDKETSKINDQKDSIKEKLALRLEELRIIQLSYTKRLEELDAIEDEVERQKEFNKLLDEMERTYQQVAEVQDLMADNERQRLEDLDEAAKKEKEKKDKEIADEKKKKVELEKSRKDFNRQLKIDEAKRKGNRVEAAKLENEKILEQERAKMKKLGIVGEQARKNEELLAAQARDRIQKAQEAMAKDADKKLGKKPDVAKNEADLEKRVTDALLKQVDSVQKLILLYQGLYYIRFQQEALAMRAADTAVRFQQNLERLEQRRAKALGHGNDTEVKRLDAVIERMRTRGQLVNQFAQKRAQEAQVAGAVGGAGGDPAIVQAKIDEVQKRVHQMQLAVRASMIQVMNDFRAAPVHWVNAFLAGWTVESQRMIAAVQATMAAIKHESKPTTHHSPSLVDIWNQNVEVASGGIDRMVNTLAKKGPQLGRLAPSHYMGLGGTAPSGGGGGGTTTNNNDNRTVRMDINNNVDMDNVTRHIGKAISSANMSVGEV